MANPEQVLVDLGFAESEAKAYVTLLRHGPLNGYELAKVSGIPRGNIYKVLDKLEQRGAAVRSESDGSTRYGPVSPEEVMSRLAERVQRRAEQAQALLEGLTTPSDADQVWNMRGYQPVLDHARSLIAQARESLVVALCREEAPALAGEMRAAQERGVAINTLCLTGCTEECGGCQGHIDRYALAPLEGDRWLIVVPDEGEALAGQIALAPEAGASALRTKQRLLVNVVAGYVRRSVALAQVAEKPGAGELAQAARRAIGMTNGGAG